MITKLGTYPLVLGIGWLRKHEPGIAWRTNKLEFISTYYQEDCLRVREQTLSAAKAPKDLSIRDKSEQSIDYP